MPHEPEITRIEAKPGDQLALHNRVDKPLLVTFKTGRGTEISVAMAPGADVDVTVGDDDLGIHLHPADYDGLKIVPK